MLPAENDFSRDLQTRPSEAQIETAILGIVTRRGPDSSACPSEIARQLQADDWRLLMPRVRQVAARLACAGHIRVTQRGRVQPPAGPWKGPIRLSLPQLKPGGLSV